MPSPIETDVLTVGEVRPLTFLTGISYSNSNNNTALFKNLTTGNNVSFNNAQITVADAASGTVTVTFNATEAGRWVAQFVAGNASGPTLKSPVFNFRVQSPLS